MKLCSLLFLYRAQGIKNYEKYTFFFFGEDYHKISSILFTKLPEQLLCKVNSLHSLNKLN